jgi:hypothetical protein
MIDQVEALHQDAIHAPKRKKLMSIIKGLALVLVLSAASCMSPKVVSQTPGSIEIDCKSGISCAASAQELADMAQEHCNKFGQNAQQDRMLESATGNRWVRYKCVPR